MTTDLLNASVLVLFVIFGFRQPAVAMAGVIWVDLYKPQLLSTSFLHERPLSMLFVMFFFMAVVMNMGQFRRPSKASYAVLVVMFMAWITLTTLNAEFPGVAWVKHDIAFKTILFAFFIPFVLRNRKEIELFVWVVVGSLGTFMFMGGGKSIYGGGYGVSLITQNPGLAWNEGSTLACQAISLLPLLYYAGKQSLLAEHRAMLKKILVLLGLACLLVLVGTQARTGLVALAVLALFVVYYSKGKSRAKVLLVLLITPFLVYPFLPDAWVNRMSTMSDTKNESSALGRIVVWRWTLDYVSERPLMGGGFNSYLANAGQLGGYGEHGEVEITAESGKAFHNIFFEVLGEQGYVGLLLYLMIIGQTLLTLRHIFRSQHSQEWQKLLGRCLFISLIVYLVGGMFIGVAYYPWVFYMHGLSIALYNSYITLLPSRKQKRRLEHVGVEAEKAL